jgi:dipeptidyl-peptidase-4
MRLLKIHLFFWVCLFFVASLFAAPSKELTVEDIYTTLKLKPKYGKTLQMLPRGKQVSYIEINASTGDQELWICDIKSNERRKILSNAELPRIGSDSLAVSLMEYQWSAKEDGILIEDLNDLFYFDFTSNQFKQITSTTEKEENSLISPDGKWISFNRHNDLFVYNLDTGQEKALTRDGSDNVLNGKLAWVYEEEFYTRGDTRGYTWSPDGRYIMFYWMDQQDVPVYPLVDYKDIHTELKMTHYPKAGDPNPVVKLGVIEVESGNIQWINTGDNKDIYLPRYYWLPDNRTVAFMCLDRLQQHLAFLFADISTGKSRVVLTEAQPQWIEIENYVYFLKQQKAFIWGSERSGYWHLYLYDYQGNLIQTLTSGNWDVTDLNGVNETKGYVFFTSTRDDITERQFYRVGLDGVNMVRLSDKSGMHDITMVNNSIYYLDEYSNSTIPAQISAHSDDGQFLEYIDENLHPELEAYDLQKPEFFQIPGDSGLTFNAFMIKPPDFNRAEKYPVLVYIYGGPNSQTVNKKFKNLWHQMMAQKGYIIFCMDNRGTGYRGLAWSRVVYRHLGKYELADHLTGIKYLQQLSYVDPHCIGIWGWSYGGYMVLYSLTHSGVFKTGVSIAPVTDWRYYDTIYTERYMGLPSENKQGYFDSAPLNFADDLKGKLFLAHGTLDDNVHFQNSVMMIDRLIDEDKKYHLEIFPNHGHSIRNTADRIYLFETITEFLLGNL